MGPVGRRPLLAAGLAGLVLVAGCAPPPAISNRVVAAVEAINPFDNQPGKLSATEIRTANMTANRAWALVGDFRGIGIWHPLAAQSARYTQADPRMEGAIRVLPLTTGGTMVDELLEWDGTRKTMRYSGVETVLPVTKFEATMSVTNNLDGTSSITWSAVFDADGVEDDQAMAAVQEFLAAGLDNLAALAM